MFGVCLLGGALMALPLKIKIMKQVIKILEGALKDYKDTMSYAESTQTDVEILERYRKHYIPMIEEFTKAITILKTKL
jgi:hypothetical protein